MWHFGVDLKIGAEGGRTPALSGARSVLLRDVSTAGAIEARKAQVSLQTLRGAHASCFATLDRSPGRCPGLRCFGLSGQGEALAGHLCRIEHLSGK